MNTDKINEFHQRYKKELISINNVRIHVINSLNRIKEINLKLKDSDNQILLYEIDRILNASKCLFSEDEIKCLKLVYEKEGVKNEKE